MRKYLSSEEYIKLVATIPEETKKFLKQCVHSTRRLKLRLIEGESEYAESADQVKQITETFRKPEDQARFSDRLYEYLEQNQNLTREQIIAEANRIADEMRKEQEKE